MTALALGIDTGGTYTDGVLLDLNTKEIIAKTKVITTRHNLNLAIENCIDALIGEYKGKEQKDLMLGRVKMVSLSTTLATNAIVEGQGAEVGLILIGFEPRQDLPTPFTASIAGGCTIKGKPKADLDLAAARMAVEEMKGKVDAFAVAGFFSVRNPEQELKTAALIRELTGYPVVCAHQLSSDLGFHERAVTAVLNARLMPLITDLIEAVNGSMRRRGINAPLMVVKGDGSLISERMAREKPIETILSGPAASITGALALTGVRDGVVVDMGGTTTDLAVLHDGRPALNSTGAMVGGWLTRVKAAEITTIGLGGDSLIEVSHKGELTIGPQRVFPLSWLASQYPYLVRELEQIRPVDYTVLMHQPTTILAYIKDPLHLELTATEKEIIKLLLEGPHTLAYIGEKLRKDYDFLSWQRLVSVGSLHRASLTPTDILHVTGRYQAWNSEAAAAGARIAARRLNVSLNEFLEIVTEELYYRLAALIADRLIRDPSTGKQPADNLSGSCLLKLALGRRKPGRLIELSARLNLPLIAVGAPVQAYFPEVAARFGSRLHMPEGAEVANAVGTVSSKIVERAIVLVKPGEGGGFLVHAPWGREMFLDMPEAIAYSRSEGEKYVYARAVSAGANEIEVIVDQQDRCVNLSGGGNDDSNAGHQLFIESVIEIAAVGKPWR